MKNVFGCKRANVYTKICNQMYCMNKQLIPWLSEKGILDAPKNLVPGCIFTVLQVIDCNLFLRKFENSDDDADIAGV